MILVVLIVICAIACLFIFGWLGFIVFTSLLIMGAVFAMIKNKKKKDIADKKHKAKMEAFYKKKAEEKAYSNKMHATVFIDDLMNKYIQGAIMSVELMNEANAALMRGETTMLVSKSLLKDIDRKSVV